MFNCLTDNKDVDQSFNNYGVVLIARCQAACDVVTGCWNSTNLSLAIYFV